uniref:Anoctamin n=1 Tax=Mesocestoides corti TaxID=53468 RepID=A0A5K3ETR2_MESCO
MPEETWVKELVTSRPSRVPAGCRFGAAVLSTTYNCLQVANIRQDSDVSFSWIRLVVSNYLLNLFFVTEILRPLNADKTILSCAGNTTFISTAQTERK